MSASQSYEIYYYHTDPLGSAVAITNSSGDVVWSADYEPFGKTFNGFSSDGFKNAYQYNSKELDKTNLLYYGARYYDPEIGRFTTADTLRGDIKDPQSLNRYTYVKNNPLKYIDPSGREPRTYKTYILTEDSSGGLIQKIDVNVELLENEYVSPQNLLEYIIK